MGNKACSMRMRNQTHSVTCGMASSRLALVTGSTSGIGLGIARVSVRLKASPGVWQCACSGCARVCLISHACHMQALASKGHDVMLHGFGTSEMVQSAIQTCCDAAPGSDCVSMLQISRYCVRNMLLGVKQGVFHHHGADLCDPDQITDMFRFMEEKYSRGPDILVNNAGVYLHVCTVGNTIS